jgi:hypothetical protein
MAQSRPAGPSGEPTIRHLTRREFVRLGLVASALVGASTAMGEDGPAAVRPGAEPRLPGSANPVQSLAFMPYDAGEDLVLWSAAADGKITAYALNPAAQLVWMLCDSRRDRERIAADYAAATRRDPAEARAALGEMERTRIVVAGQRVTLRGTVPRSAGRWRRVDRPPM